ncbi:MAG: M14 family metallopeptidase [Armatimonadota bacterium]|nr:M14 family metallopeptidase [Armatimonadota bacterium]
MSEEMFSAGTAAAVPGQKARGVLEVAGTDLRLPLTLVCGLAPGPTVLVTAGVHGGEYPGIEAAIRLARELDPGQVRGRVAIVHICGISAFHARMQYLTPEDGKNPNRVYPGRATGTVSERLAYTIMETFVARADAWIDLHGGDIHEALWPFTIHSAGGPPDVASRARAMADAFGIRHIIVSEAIAGGTYGAAAARGVPAILVEAGGLGQLDEESVAIHLRGVHSVLRMLRVLPGSPQPVSSPVRLSRFDWLRAEQAGCWYPAVRPGEQVKAGQAVGVIRDYWGEVLADYRVPADGVVLFVVTSLAINPGDPLAGIGVV